MYRVYVSIVGSNRKHCEAAAHCYIPRTVIIVQSETADIRNNVIRPVFSGGPDDTECYEREISDLESSVV